MKKVFINQLVEYPALNMTTKGIIDGLEDGYKQGVNLDLRVESVQQANPVLASQIAAKFIAQNAEM
ncbi:MAG: ABC transporter substrate binding protein [Candidatus Rickettsia vulgarisii]